MQGPIDRIAVLIGNGVQALANLAAAIGVALTANHDGASWAAITAAAVVKASAGRIARLVVVVPGSAGTFTLNDVATVGGASAGNTIFTMAFNNAKWLEGATFDLFWPCASGIVVSAVPTGGKVSISFD